MKKLIFILTAVISASVLSATIDEDDFNGSGKPTSVVSTVVRTNGVEWTRRGSMGIKDYVMTDIDTSKNVKKGIQTIGCEDIDQKEVIVTSVWVSVDSEYDVVSGKLRVKIPAIKDNDYVYIDGVKVYVASSMAFFQTGWEYISILNDTDIHNFSYMSLGTSGYMGNMPFCYGTNRVDATEVDKFEFPRGGKNETIQNDHLIFADRAWITNFVIKAGIKTEAEVRTILEGM